MHADIFEEDIHGMEHSNYMLF